MIAIIETFHDGKKLVCNLMTASVRIGSSWIKKHYAKLRTIHHRVLHNNVAHEKSFVGGGAHPNE